MASYMEQQMQQMQRYTFKQARKLNTIIEQMAEINLSKEAFNFYDQQNQVLKDRKKACFFQDEELSPFVLFNRLIWNITYFLDISEPNPKIELHVELETGCTQRLSVQYHTTVEIKTILLLEYVQRSTKPLRMILACYSKTFQDMIFGIEERVQALKKANNYRRMPDKNVETLHQLQVYKEKLLKMGPDEIQDINRFYSQIIKYFHIEERYFCRSVMQEPLEAKGNMKNSYCFCPVYKNDLMMV